MARALSRLEALDLSRNNLNQIPSSLFRELPRLAGWTSAPTA